MKPGLILFAAVCYLLLLSDAQMGASEQAGFALSATEAAEVGRKVWQNECGASISGLTSWNLGEEFPSLGIGHFIWYPEGVKGPFAERFPDVLAFLEAHQVKLPAWLNSNMACPWKSRDEFLKEQESRRMIELRDLLSSTVALQTEYLVQRMQKALPKMLEKAPEADRNKIKANFERMLKSGSKGVFALIDYVNFKGEGIVETERYKGEGWGMMQVLSSMPEEGDPVKSFAESARAALTRRVANSPPARNEQRWLPGWTKRVNAYWQ